MNEGRHQLIARIVEFSARNQALVFATTTLLVLAGLWSLARVPLDALPDLSDTQVIVYSRWDQSPDVVEAQLTYPIVSALSGAPGVRAVRGISDFGSSFVYVIFDDATDLYWARSRVQEYLAPVLAELPSDARTELGPDASGVGWIYQYALVDSSGKHSLADLRRVQDFYLRYHLRAVPGVAEVAAVGGFEKQYQINPDPNRLLAYGIPIQAVVEAVRAGNVEAGGRLLELGGTEYMIRGRGYASSIEDFEQIVVGSNDVGSPIRVRDIGTVVLGPSTRRGLADLDGRGEVVSGIVVMRHAQNANAVIERVRAKLEEIRPGLPEGVSILPVYDRSELIRSAVENLRARLLEIVFVTSLVIFLFLRHGPSALIPVITIPVAVILSFIPFHALGLTANIMSLGGIAIAVGALADGAIVVVEQAHKRLEEWEARGRPGDPREVVLGAIRQVAGPSFFSLLVIAVSFLPVLTLEAQEGRLFKPLAYTKTLAMLAAALLVLTLDPALRVWLMRRRPCTFRPRWLASAANAVLVGRIHHEDEQRLSRSLRNLYGPAATWCLDHKLIVVLTAVLLMGATVPAYRSLGTEFMPPLDEGTLFYMPTTMPGISITEAQRLLQVTDGIIAGFPEVDRVLGKAGRAETATDPAPLSMLETLVTLKPKSEWRRVPTWYSAWAPDWLRPLLGRVTPDHISMESLVEELDEAVRLPGLSNAWTMPIKARTDMLATGIRTPVGLKISGGDLAEIERIALEVETHLSGVHGTRSVFAERTGQGYFLDIRWRREELARYGVSLAQAQAVVQSAIGGEIASRTVEGTERYTVIVRYPADFRSDVAALERVLVSVGPDRQIPLGQLADVGVTSGPGMIRDENGLLTGYVYVDLGDRDPASYIDEADALLREEMQVPAGYALAWSGQYEAMERVRERLTWIVPATLALIVLLIYLNTRSAVKTSIVLLAVPFSAIGAIWLLWALGYNLSIAVWIGLIALLGVDAETGVFMLLYLDLAYDKARAEGRLASLPDLRRAVYEGAVTRLRPKFMTAVVLFVGLVPVLLSSGVGSDVMKRIAAPMVGGIVTSFLLELLVYPVIYEWWKGFELKRLATGSEAEAA